MPKLGLGKADVTVLTAGLLTKRRCRPLRYHTLKLRAPYPLHQRAHHQQSGELVGVFARHILPGDGLTRSLADLMEDNHFLVSAHDARVRGFSERRRGNIRETRFFLDAIA